jgi:hypothetical protein
MQACSDERNPGHSQDGRAGSFIEIGEGCNVKMTDARRRALSSLQKSIDYHHRNGWFSPIDGKAIAGNPKDRSAANMAALVKLRFAARYEREGHRGGSKHWTYDITDEGRAENARFEAEAAGNVTPASA